MQGIVKLISLGILISGVSAQAGQKLHLKAKQIDTNQSADQVFMSQSTFMTAYQIIQFKAPIRLQDQEWLKSLKIDILRYIPEDAYVARLNDLKALKALGRSELIQAVVAYEPDLRINNKALSLSVFNENQKQNLHVRTFNGANLETIKSKLNSVPGLTIIEQSKGAFIVNVPSGQAQKLARIEGLEWVDVYRAPQLQKVDPRKMFKTQEDPFVSSFEADGSLTDLTGYETGTKVMNFKSAWRKGLTGAGQVVAIADTGLDTGKLSNLSEDFSGLKRAYIGGIDSQTWGDPNGHGTHVAGSVLNSGRSSSGLIRGGAYNAELVMEAMYSSAYGTITIGPDPSPLFEVAYNDGARIHSNSWGSITDYGIYDDTARSVDQFMFENQDMLILFSAGNEGVDANQDGRIDKGSVTAPSTAKNVLTVGASENLVSVGGVQIPLGLAGDEETGFRWPAEPIASDTFSDNINGLSAFSSRGPTDDGRLKPDVVAPGTNILSNCSKHPEAGQLWGAFNSEFCYSGGTSMSTPLVAAAAALVRENLIRNRNIENPNASLIKAVLMHSAVDMFPGQYGAIGKERGQEILKPGPNIDQGYGRVDVSKAVSRNIMMLDEKKGLATGERKEVKLPDGTRRVTLVYTDAPGSTAATKALVNNLDIKVKTSTGLFFVAKSKINNSEQLKIPAGSKGLTLVVTGKNVPMGIEGRQPFSVVYSK